MTITLPLTEHGLNVLLVALLIALLSGVVWLALGADGQKSARDPARRALEAFGWIYMPVWLVILAGTLWALWLVFSGSESPIALDGFRSLGLGALIAALLGAPFVIWGTVLKHQTVTFQKEGHMTDRITSAVEQLGAEKVVKKIIDGATQETSEPNIEVRIGAILSLERIAQDSTRHDNGRDHVRVMEILCAYIRQNSNAQKPVDFPLAEWVPLKDDPTDEESAAHLNWREVRFGAEGGPLTRQWAKTLPEPHADVQLALSVIGRRSALQRKVEAAWPDPPEANTEWPFDTPAPSLPDDPGADALSRAELDAFRAGLEAWQAKLRDYRGYRLDLRGANLQRADMAAKQPDGSDAVFSGALLAHARMEGADLRLARMEGADLRWARMTGANADYLRGDGADLGFARLEAAVFTGAKLSGANLYRASAPAAQFNGALMPLAELRLICLHGANLRFCRLQGGNLINADLTQSSLVEARIQFADLFSSKIGAVLRGANLRHTNLQGKFVTTVSLGQTFGDASVTLPEGITRPAHWPDWTLPDAGENSFITQWRKWQTNPAAYTPPDPPS